MPHAQCRRHGAHHAVSVPRRALRGHAPKEITMKRKIIFTSFSAPKGVERACPHHGEIISCSAYLVSVPRRALRGHAPKSGAQPLELFKSVSVPRRALRGHAPQGSPAVDFRVSRFSAPKGVERACPHRSLPPPQRRGGFSAPKGVERACPRHLYTPLLNS